MALVINFIAGPGAGKSTLAALLFAELKLLGINCELVTEYAKQLTWHDRHGELEDQVYVFAKQFHKMWQLRNKVDVIITDSPLILSNFYNEDKFWHLPELVRECEEKFDNLYYFVERSNRPYNPKGRNQTEEESCKIDGQLKQLLRSEKIGCIDIKSERESVDLIIKQLKEFGWIKCKK